MNQLSEFVVNHWALSLAFVVVSVLLIVSEVRRRLYGAQQVGPQAATRLMNDGATVLDVREDSEYKQGHLADALHIPMSQFGKRVGELEKHKDKTLLVYCRTGSRSNGAAALLRKQGYPKVYNLAGGLAAWQNANLPITRK